MKNKSVESEVNNLSVIITKRNNGERELLQKQGQSQSQTTMAGDNLITCNTQLAKSFNILKNPFDKDVSGNYYKKILVNNYKNNTNDSNNSSGISNESSIDSDNIQESHKNINIHENNFFYDVINSNADSSQSKNKDKRDLIPGTLNVKTCKHINHCTCNQAPVPLTEALQNISLAYNPITKQLHFSTSPGSSPKHHDHKVAQGGSSDLKQYHYFSNDVLNKDTEKITSKYAEDSTSIHSFEDVFDQNLNSNGFSDGTHSSVSEHSDIAESLILESVGTDISKHTEEDLCLGSVDSKKAGFTGFLSRAVSTIVGEGAQSKGWKLWPGRSTPEQKYSHVVASSTALIQHIRPPTLPAKDSAEESRHRAEYQRMLMEARQKEQRELEIKKTQQQSRVKREEAQAHRVKQWQEILPKFSQLRSLPHTRALWWHGLPPCTRGRVWILAIGNSLNVTHDDYLSCVQKARTKIALKKGLVLDSSFPVDSDRLYELFAIDGKTMKSELTKAVSEKYLKSNESRPTSTKLSKELKSQVNVKLNTTSKSNNHSLNTTNNVSLAYLNLKQSEISTVSNYGGSSSDVSSDEDACLEVIQLDISRTFPSLGVFQHGGPYYPILHALLAAYVTYKPDVGYVQGMSFLAAILILNMEPEDAFICFCNILEKPLHRAAFSLDQREMRAYFRAYEDLLRNNLPVLHAHFSELGLSSDLYCVDWLYAAFSRAMPLDIACRVWDLFVRDGEAFLFRTAVGVLHLYQSQLLEMDFIAAAQFLTRLPDTLSPDKLFRSIRQVNMTINKSSFVQLVETYKGHV